MLSKAAREITVTIPIAPTPSNTTTPTSITVKRKMPWMFIYVQEAHAYDEWRFGQPRDIVQHKSLSQRYSALRAFQEDFQFTLPFFVDEVMQGCGNPAHAGRCSYPNFERLYQGWPLGAYFIDADGTCLSVYEDMSDTVNVAEWDATVETTLAQGFIQV